MKNYDDRLKAVIKALIEHQDWKVLYQLDLDIARLREQRALLHRELIERAIMAGQVMEIEHGQRANDSKEQH